ncbi:MAG: hypothetical protein ISS53_05920 [Dehalococcoidia bacterium]|nr:hypothetical protein [Dehalococcoidia bacterium]
MAPKRTFKNLLGHKRAIEDHIEGRKTLSIALNLHAFSTAYAKEKRFYIEQAVTSLLQDTGLRAKGYIGNHTHQPDCSKTGLLMNTCD